MAARPSAAGREPPIVAVMKADTSMNVTTISVVSPPAIETLPPSPCAPRLPCVPCGMISVRTSAPATAPRHCMTIYIAPRVTFIFRAIIIAKVTAGLR